MRKAMRWRYWCDHCNKGGASGGAMAKHEKHCTLNPQRTCRMCEYAGDVVQQPMAELIAAFRSGGLPALRELAEGCPVCIFAAIRQDYRARQTEIDALPPLELHAYWESRAGFDFRGACKSYLQDINNAREEHHYAH